MKTIKRNAVIVTVMLFICAAVYLNWSYNNKVEEAGKVGGDSQQALGDKSDGNAPSDEPSDAPTQSGAETLGNITDEGDAGLYYTVQDTQGDGGTDAAAGKYGEYFAQVRLERSEARDRASATLTTVAGSDGASPETVDMALKAMAELAQRAVEETEIENLIRAKGFIDCVVYISDQGVKVTVAKEGGLTEASAAQITEVVVSETGITPDKLTVTEIK